MNTALSLAETCAERPVFSAAVYPSLRGKRVVVTGGGSGIGASLVEAFVRQGALVSFLDNSVEASRALERSLSTLDSPPRFYACDLCDLDRVRETLVRVGEEGGPIQVLINNAANDDRHSFEDVTHQYWEDGLAVNLRHLFFCAQAVTPGMKAAGGGAIINFGSVSWHLGLAGLSVYQTAKAGIEGMTRAMARELGGYGIRVTCVIPGAVRTARQMRLWHTPDEEARILAQQCVKARVEPEDVALARAIPGFRRCENVYRPRVLRGCGLEMTTASERADRQNRQERFWTANAGPKGEAPGWAEQPALGPRGQLCSMAGCPKRRRRFWANRKGASRYG